MGQRRPRTLKPFAALLALRPTKFPIVSQPSETMYRVLTFKEFDELSAVFLHVECLRTESIHVCHAQVMQGIWDVSTALLHLHRLLQDCEVCK